MPRLNPFASGRTKLTKLWDASIDGHVVSLAWSDALGLVAAASAEGPITLFDAKTGQARFTLDGHGFGTSHLAWSPDGQRLASAGQDGKVRLWDPIAGKQTHALAAGVSWVERVAWGPALASAAGKKLRLWNRDGEMLREYPDHASTITDIQWHPKESILASVTYGMLAWWRPDEAAAVRELKWASSMLAVAWSPDARHIAVGGQDSTVHFWVVATGDNLQMSGYPTKVRELSWDATGRWMATGGGEAICVWDFAGAGPEGSTPIQLEAHTENLACLAYQPRGALLASGGEDGLVALWQPSMQQGPLALARHDAAVSQLAWSSDDRRLAVGTAEGSIALYTT